MSAPDQKSRKAARKFAARDGIKYVAARRMLIELGLWGRETAFYDELLADLDARQVTLRDVVTEACSTRIDGAGRSELRDGPGVE